MQFAPLYPVIHQFLKPCFPACLWAGPAHAREIALTFDDGPHPEHTPQLLDVLDHYQVRASFFWLGACVQRFPDIARAVWERGHWIGLHGYHHHSFPRLSTDQFQKSLLDTQLAIADACRVDLTYVQTHVRDVRPPNGFFTPQTLQYLRQWNYRPVMWSVVPEDWVRPGVDIVVQRVLQQTCNGSLIVLHDGYHGGMDAAPTIAQLLPHLIQQNYEFVTVDQLWQRSLLQS